MIKEVVHIIVIEIPGERRIAGLSRSDMHFMADIAYAACIVCDDETYYIRARCFIDMRWVGSISGMTITKVPLVGYDVVVARRGAMEMNLQAITLRCFPGEGSIALGFGFTDMDFMAYITDAAAVVRDDETHEVRTGRIIDMGWISAIAF